MVVDKIKTIAVTVVVFLAVALGSSALLASCEDQTGGYPTPSLSCTICGGEH